MRAWPLIARLSRPALAVVALYALVLGTFLGGLQRPALASLSHVLCSPTGETGAPPGPPSADHRDCCTLACPGGTSPVPLSVSAALPGLERDPAFVPWAAAREQAPGRASIRDTRARGPPFA